MLTQWDTRSIYFNSHGGGAPGWELWAARLVVSSPPFYFERQDCSPHMGLPRDWYSNDVPFAVAGRFGSRDACAMSAL